MKKWKYQHNGIQNQSQISLFETVETPKGMEIPNGWRLAWHQVETFKALQNPDIDVVFNTAMTGDGKSLAAYLGVLQGDTEAIALYPTNELARDQENQIRKYVEDFQPNNQPRIARLNSAELELYAENEGIKNQPRSLRMAVSARFY